MQAYYILARLLSGPTWLYIEAENKDKAVHMAQDAERGIWAPSVEEVPKA
jgi:hypothetical protein